jgi:hypothetical protein
MENTAKTFKITLFDYYKIILEKVSFYPPLFKKELRKALRNLNIYEARQLITWCRERTGKLKKYRTLNYQKKSKNEIL